jgi:hypothetical protein
MQFAGLISLAPRFSAVTFVPDMTENRLNGFPSASNH